MGESRYCCCLVVVVAVHVADLDVLCGIQILTRTFLISYSRFRVSLGENGILSYVLIACVHAFLRNVCLIRLRYILTSCVYLDILYHSDSH